MEMGLRNGNVSGSRDQDGLKKGTQTIQDFVNEFPNWERRMNRYIRDLQEIANGIDRYHKGATIANVTGSSLGAVGGVLALAGIITAPFTAGISLVLTAVGTSIGVAGTAAKLTADLVEYGEQSTKQIKVDEIIKRYKSDLKETLEHLTEIFSVLQSHLVEREIAESYCNEIKTGVTAGYRCYSIIMQTAEVTRSIMAKQVLSKTTALEKLAKKPTALSRIARTGTKCPLYATPIITVFSGVMAGASIAWNICSIAKDSIVLSKGSKSEVAKKLRDQAQKIEEVLKDHTVICKILKKILERDWV
ncbi:apolipoprotein L3-like [Hypanus sabinus]|uniref:apolipoprotein L3-like n=1 Tax=Hypanus sabinus TaxID=79690 RepID=UPI0028C4B1D2|nr:apolipoprotein L3-like [Hypanus sabinus]XP_059849556.1 apolipoprotein L3-like [Hypanus sabinus]XP_059849557.1 apolipoprotein L3-like [Hypanus sabinus]XP_059849558.1 apolipoprotein L3-like [Hypanus sabinus]